MLCSYKEVINDIIGERLIDLLVCNYFDIETGPVKNSKKYSNNKFRGKSNLSVINKFAECVY